MRPASRRAFALGTWALALVASKTILISESSSTAWMPSALARMPSARARASPSELGSMPARRTSSICPACFRSLYIKSLPMLPEPIMATLTWLSEEFCHSITFLRENKVFFSLIYETNRDLPYRGEHGAIGLACCHCSGGTHGSWQHKLTCHLGYIVLRTFVCQP